MELKAGDIVYGFTYSKCDEKHVIERVTKTQAIAGNVKFKINVSDRDYIEKIGAEYGFFRRKYMLENPQRKAEYERHEALTKLTLMKWDNFTTDQLQYFIKKIGEYEAVSNSVSA